MEISKAEKAAQQCVDMLSEKMQRHYLANKDAINKFFDIHLEMEEAENNLKRIQDQSLIQKHDQ